jgi:NAD(P)-dependent dehydrogenase (short-subunit alcohol dehydrogenase family)/acyl carrier protein
VVVTLPSGGELEALLPHPAPIARVDGGYIITGGLGWLGQCAARYLAKQGARCLVLNSRSAPSAQAEATIAELRASGVDVHVVHGDISRPETARHLVDTVDQCGVPLRGVLHAAGVLNDAAVWNTQRGQVERTWSTKAAGAWWLHQATEDRPLDWFVLYSSMAALLPGPGQANHSGACAYLNALASWRREQGLPATAISWGAWAEFGQGAHMREQGLTVIEADEGMAAFERIMQAAPAVTTYCPLDFRQRIAPHTGLLASPYVASLTEQGADASRANDDRLRAELESCSSDERLSRLESFVLDQAGIVLRLSDTTIDLSTPMTAYGMDSLTSMELRGRLESALRLKLPATFVFAHPTPTALAAYLAGQLDPVGTE